MKYVVLVIKALLTLAFVAAGAAKIFGAEMMVQTFEQVGVGQWFRYVTGFIEIGGAALLWLPARQWLGAGLLMVTMVGATLAHFLVLGAASGVPAIILGLLAAFVLFTHRDQLPLNA